jgi:RimJ/RimL family protein N-acetyltransferase
MIEPLPIRAATPDDSIAYEHFMAGIFAENLDTLCPRIQNPSSDQVRAWMSTHTGETSVVLLATRDGQLLGTLNLSRFARPHLDHAVGLGLNVRADVRGQGIGRALLRAGLAWFASALAIERIELEVVSHNASAIHLYEEAGFMLEGRKLGAVRKGSRYLDLLVMGLHKNSQPHQE